MNILHGQQFVRKVQSAQQGVLVGQALQVSSVGLISSIAEAIENRDNIKTRKAMTSAFAKIQNLAVKIQKDKKAEIAFTGAEENVLGSIGDAVKGGLISTVKAVAKTLFSSFFKAVRLTVVPIFRIFTMVVGQVFRMILANPYTLAAAALVTAAVGGYAYYRKRDSEMRGESDANILGTPESPTQPQAGAPLSGADAAKQAIVEAAKKNGVPAELALKISYAESRWQAGVVSKTGGSAQGLFGVINKVWAAYGGTAADRGNIAKDADIGTRIIAENARNIKRVLGRDPTYSDIYVTHHFGPSAAKTLNNLNPKESVETWLGRFQSTQQVIDVMRLNPNLKRLTIGELIDSFDTKLGMGKQTWAEGVAANDTFRLNPPKQAAAGKASGSFIIPAAGVFTSGFGLRDTGVDKASTYHEGIDIAAPVGTPVYAADGGIVTKSTTVSGGYGTLIVIDHGNGFQTYYGHSNKILAEEGQAVARGQQIAEMGNKGHSSGPHLHFEIRQVIGKSPQPVDPAQFLPGFPTTKYAKITAGQIIQSAQVEKDYIKLGNKLVAIR